MTTEEQAIAAIKTLPPSQQREVLNFIQSLRTKLQASEVQQVDQASETSEVKASLGERLMAIRQQAIENEMQLVTFEEVKEIAAERDRHRELWTE
ncbi:MAG: hypothetical protein C4288_02605 [Leptolyngbya sp. ERB_1_1]